MIRAGKVFYNGTLAGLLSDYNDGYKFEYSQDYLVSNSPSISLTLPKSKKIHTSQTLFPFFYGLLAEGLLKDAQCRALMIDENDSFGRLLGACVNDTIGCVTIKDCTNEMQ